MDDTEELEHIDAEDAWPAEGLAAPGYGGAGAPVTSYPALAWMVIVVCVGFTVYLQNQSEPPLEEGPGENLTRDAMLDFQGKNSLGAAEIAHREGHELGAELNILNSGDPSQRLRYLVLLGELEGSPRALSELDDLRERLAEANIELTGRQVVVVATLERLWRAAKAKDESPSIDEESRLALIEELGWYGELALETLVSGEAGEKGMAYKAARETFNSTLFAVFLGSLCLLTGFLSLVFLLLGVVRKRMDFGIGGSSGFGGIYLEAFALWIFLFILINQAIGLLELATPSLLPALFAFAFSLVALCWPSLRGVPWERVRSDIGLTSGRSVIAEVFSGVMGYLMSLPLLVAGVLVFLMIIAFTTTAVEPDKLGAGFEPVSYPAHPIMEWILAGQGSFLGIVLLACVAAPVVEEIMFRGLLYRYLREASLRRGLFFSAFFSALLSSFLFAIVHPQGLAVVPVLMGLACGFCLVREWRVSLLPAMVAHGLNNFIALNMARLIFDA